VLDERGRLLSAASEPASALGLTSRQFAIQQEMEAHLRSKAEAIVQEVVGRGNARVQVAASINFDRVERTVQNVDPERQVASTEQKAEIVPGAQGGAGSSNVATTFENSRSTEVFAPAVGSLKRLTVAVLINEAPDSVRGTAAPTALQLARIDTLVRSAVGFDSTRGDQVSVVSVPFATAAAPPAAETPIEPTTMETVREYQPLIFRIGGLVLAFVLGLLALRASKPQAVAVSSPAMFAQDAPRAAIGAEGATRGAPELATVPAANDMRRHVGSTINQQPDVAAKLVRAWMKES
jgi:flagellar M-ring protein FliF